MHHLFYISHFQVAASKDPDTAFFKKLDGFQPCEINELKAGTHIFAVYGKHSLFTYGTFESI